MKPKHGHDGRGRGRIISGRPFSWLVCVYFRKLLDCRSADMSAASPIYLSSCLFSFFFFNIYRTHDTSNKTKTTIIVR